MHFPPHADVDYVFYSIAEARRRIEGRLWAFDHLGETDDPPKFNDTELIDGASTPHNPITTSMLDYEALDDPNAVIFISHLGGISRPPVAVPHRDTRFSRSALLVGWLGNLYSALAA